MRRCVALLAGSAECVVRDNAPDMIAVLEDLGATVSLVSLDHDLRPLAGKDGKARNPGTGMDVADWLAGRGPDSPVIVHTSSNHAARAMLSTMEAAGLQTGRIAPWGELDWVEAMWLPAVLEMLSADGA